METYQKIINLVKSDIEKINVNLCAKLQLEQPLLSQVKEFLNAPAKRIRPLIAILWLKSSGLTLNEYHYKLLSAVELVHNASLIHDDVIDDSDIRRCRKTLNKTFNPKIAVVTGDYLLSCALEYINELNSPKIIEKFTQTLVDMCRGEFSQYFNINKIPQLEEYLYKTEQKTAKLFMTALECSMVLSDIDPAEALEFGKNFGMAFQIKDDLTNILTTKTDLENGVYTAPVILSGNIDRPAIEKTKVLLNNFIDNALKILGDLEDNEYKKALERIMELYRK